MAGDRAVAWALGLGEGSPLIPVTDVLLTAPHCGLDPDTTLGHLFGMSAFTDPVRAGDRHWHSWPGTALNDLAFELGYPLFFGPDTDHPQPVSLPGLETTTVGMLEAAGISPAWIYACQHIGGLPPRPDGSFASGRDQAEWGEVISRYVRVHQPGGEVDHEAETCKLQNIMTIVTLQMAADDPGYGAAMATQLPAGRRALTQPCCASTCAPARMIWAARCAATAGSSWRRVSTSGTGWRQPGSRGT
ncbi:MAG: hypothetical protein ACLQDY_26880 [Streptosporangiaceae bacterium]